jgi:hypothetical protein
MPREGGLSKCGAIGCGHRQRGMRAVAVWSVLSERPAAWEPRQPEGELELLTASESVWTHTTGGSILHTGKYQRRVQNSDGPYIKFGIARHLLLGYTVALFHKRSHIMASRKRIWMHTSESAVT